MNLHEARDLLHYIISVNPHQAMMLWGPPGVGKSSIVEQLGETYEIPVREMRTSQMDPIDVKGIPQVVNGRTVFCPPAELPDAARDGEEGLLFVDEINAGSRATMAAFMQLFLTRRLGEYELPEGWIVLAAGNRTTDHAVANAMPTSLNNRLMHFHIEPDLDTTVKYGLEKGWPMEVLQFLRLRPELLHKMTADVDEDAFPSPRSWEFVVGAKITEIANPTLRREALLACVGQAGMVEFEGFLQTFSTLPSIDDVILNPLTAPMPEEMTAKYAVITALIKRAERGTINAIVQYLSRFEEKEFSVLGMKDIMAVKPELAQTRAMIAWMTDNQDYLMN